MEKQMLKLTKVMSFVEGALNVEMSQAWDSLEEAVTEPNEVPITIYFPSATADGGWFNDSLEFESLKAATDFFHKVALIIKIGRLQQREPHDENWDSEDTE